jgi:tetratricopeptide (TPR) repeat protein/DNA-binding CsgD family transcriptional regulator
MHLTTTWTIIIFLVCFLLHKDAFGSSPEDFRIIDSIAEDKTNRPDSAFFLLNDIYANAHTVGNKELSAYCALELGEILYYLGDFDRANEFLIEAISYYESSGNKNKLAEAYTWQGIVVQYAKQLPIALSLYRKALDLYLNLQDSTKIGELYGWIGHYYEKSEQLDTALIYQVKAMNLLETQEKLLPLAQVYDNIGSLYEDLGGYDSAYYYFNKSLAINSAHKEINNQIVNLNNLGDVNRKTGKLSQSLIYTDSALRMAEAHKIDYQIRSAHRDYAKTYFLQGDFEKAYQHLEVAYQLYSDILNEENSRRIALLQTVYETERQKSQIQLLEKEKRINRILYLTLVCALLAIILIAVIVIRHQKFKVHQSRKIISQKTELYEKEKILKELEVKNAVLKEDKLKSEIDNQKFIENELQKSLELKSQLITSQTLQIIRKNNFLENLKQELNVIKKSEKSERIGRINALMRSINYDITADENWNDFNTIFSQVHKDFFTNLKLKYPGITPTELRLCSLLKLNLNSEEIATILGISTDSLRISRYRLRKKLHLHKNENLVSHLINI